MATAFISEHTAEYILAPQLIAVLAKHFLKVIPLYFLSTREGSNVSRRCDQSQYLRIVNVFARRPKIEVPGQPRVEVKFNSKLFDTASLSAYFGIPTFAGVPLFSSIMELTLAARCAWFFLSGTNDVDVYYHLLLNGTVDNQSKQSPAVEGPLNEEEIIEKVNESCRLMQWDEAIDRLKVIRRASGGSIYGGGYHPFTLLLFDTEF
jgi:hypothetical protein